MSHPATSAPWIADFVALISKATRQKDTTEEAIALKEGHLPKHIYKYLSVKDETFKGLEDNTVWMASPKTFNDPYDCTFTATQNLAAEQFKETVRAKLSIKKIKFDNDRISQYVENAVQSLANFRHTMKTSCFSAVNDSLLMWAHYARSHQGCCIEYDIEPLRPTDPIRRNLYPVIYSNDLFDLTSYVVSLAASEDENFNHVLPLLSVLHKSDDWSYEKEWRLVRFYPGIFLDKTQAVPRPSKLFLGSRTSGLDKDKIVATCSKHGIEVWQMSVLPDRFELVAKPYVAL
jgi:hypothetical protein